MDIVPRPEGVLYNFAFGKLPLALIRTHHRISGVDLYTSSDGHHKP